MGFTYDGLTGIPEVLKKYTHGFTAASKVHS